MPPRITISPDRVRQVASQFRQSSGQSDQMVNTLQTQVNSMQGEWEGLTATSFMQAFQTWQTQMKQFVQLLESVAKELEAHAIRFEQADQQGAARA